MKLSRVCVATDLSERADEAIRLGDVWARRHGAELIVIHAVPELVGVNVLFPHRTEQERELMRTLCERAHAAVVQRTLEVTTRGAGAFSVEILRGPPVREILDAVRSLGVELLVVGESPPRGLLQAPSASTVAQLVRDAPIPVLVARVPDADQAPETRAPRQGRGAH